MSVQLVRGDAAHLPLPDGSVDLVVTSPPYFALRSYQDNGAHYSGQIGSEATPAEFIDALIACTREWVRVLKPSGSLWVNLGDKYSGAQQQNSGRQSVEASSDYWRRTDPRRTGIPSKSLMGLPWRYALRCVDDLGLILRAEVIWSKPNGLPESVTDRVRRSHEQWFHFVQRPRYYAAVDTIREPHADRRDLAGAKDRNGYEWARDSSGMTRQWEPKGQREYNALGKLPGSVWSIPSQPLTVPAHLGVDHFAAFPMEWPRRIIQGWSPAGICTGCGEGRRPVHDGTEKILTRPRGVNHVGQRMREVAPGNRSDIGNVRTVHRVTGECCGCTPYTDHPGSGGNSGPAHRDMVANGHYSNLGGGNGAQLSTRPKVGPWREYHDWTPPPTRPAVVLDPFSGTGTVCLVADVLGRHGIGVDLSHDYNRLARWRTTDPGERARAMQVEKPEPQLDGQLGLFEDVL